MPDQYPPSDRAATRSIPLATRILFPIAMVFTIIGFTESAFMAYDVFSGGALSSQRAPDLGVGVRSWTEHHAMRPGFSAPDVHTNSFGLRSPEVAVPKPAGTFRILLLGDSMTYGLRAADDNVFARGLERRLRKVDGAPPIEVVNAGILSYCPLLEFLQYRNHLHILEPDLVVLNFDMSDVQDNMEYSRNTVYASDGTPLFVTEPSLARPASALPELLSFQWIARKYRAVTRRVEANVEGRPFARDLDRFVWTFDGGPELDAEVQKTFAPIADLSRLLQYERIPFVLAVYPHAWQVSADATPLPPIREQYGIGMHTLHLNDRPFRKLDRFASEHGIRFVNAVSAFRQAPDPAGLFLANDLHFSTRGHELYADVLTQYIREQILKK